MVVLLGIREPEVRLAGRASGLESDANRPSYSVVSNDRLWRSSVVGLTLGVAVATPGVDAGAGPISLSILATATSLFLAILFFPERLARYKPGKVDVAVLLFIVLSLTAELIGSLLLERPVQPYLSYNWLIFYAGFIAANIVTSDGFERLAFLKSFVFLGPLMALIGVLQAARVQPVVEVVLSLTRSEAALTRIERGESFTRSTGLVGHWTGFGSYLLVVTVGLLLLISLEKSRSIKRYISLILIAMGVLSTFTFSVVLAFLFISAVFFIQSRKALRLVLGGIALTVAANIFFGDAIRQRIFQQYGDNPGALSSSSGIIPESVMLRIEIWISQLIPIIVERPIFGWGQGLFIHFGEWVRFPDELSWRSPESQWFGILAQSGLLGFLSLCFVVFALWNVSRRQVSSLRGVLLAFLVSCVLISFTVPQFTNAGLPAALLAIYGMLSTGPESAEQVSADSSRTKR